MKLDFLVIGAQKAGTTSLWQYLREHPRIGMPRAKEVPFFTGQTLDLDQFNAGIRTLLAEAPKDALLGKVTPSYMIGNLTGRPGAQVEVVAERIASTLPDVKLISLLRDPIERAVSSYMMALRRKQEARSVNIALEELLGADELASARLRPTPTNSYLIAGEYGRILEAYGAFFQQDQLLVAYTEDLARDPGALLDSVLSFLGLPTGFRPDDLGIRHFRGGTRKLMDRTAKELLFKFHREEILPHMRGSPTLHRKAFEFFVETWNVAPSEEPLPVSPDVRARLEEHFRLDAEKLAELGLLAPWVARWEREPTPGA